MECCVSDLPKDLLRMILERLSVIDLIRVGAVSKTLHDISRSCISEVLGNPRTPWLMLIPELSASKADAYLMNLKQGQNKRCYAVSGLGDKAANIIGCSKGWLALMDTKANPDLFNPFTRTQIRLPQIEQLNSRIGDNRSFVLWRGLIEQAIVSVDDNNKVNGAFVRHFEPQDSRILYWRRGDECWFSLNRGERSYTACYIVFEDNKLYVLDWFWSMEVWDFSNNKPERKRDTVFYGPHLRRPRDTAMKKYLVRLGEREFLLAMRYWWTLRTESWELYKMIDPDGLDWERVQALEGYTVFLGGSEPVVFLADKISGYRSNTIHYSSDLAFRGILEDAGVFDMESNSFDNIVDRVHSTFPTMSLWIVPNLSE